MRVAVWNMSHWSRTEEGRRKAWRVLRDELHADVALLQEARPYVEHGDSVVYRAIGGARSWGSAIIGLTVDVHEITHAKGRANTSTQPLARTWPGSIAVATASFDGQALTFVSMYGLIDDGYADTTVHRQLSDLVPLFDSPNHEGTIILGGDLNITTQWTGAQRRYRDWETATFARISSFGLADCLDLHRAAGPYPGCNCDDGATCRHIQTQRHPRSLRPWQNDYLFASVQLVAPDVLTRAGVHDSVSIQQLGDHMPLVAEFSL